MGEYAEKEACKTLSGSITEKKCVFQDTSFILEPPTVTTVQAEIISTEDTSKTKDQLERIQTIEKDSESKYKKNEKKKEKEKEDDRKKEKQEKDDKKEKKGSESPPGHPPWPVIRHQQVEGRS